MKPIGFFFAVFLGMLAVFLLATGEVARWISPEDLSTRVEIEPLPGGPGATDDRNIFKLEFWDVKKGRRRFIIRAELNQESLQADDPLDKLQEITLRDGVIELPFGSPGLSPATALSGPGSGKLVLRFENAVYRKSDGLTGKTPLFVQLQNGSGKADDGTEFFFEELLFFQSREDKSRFEIRSEKPVRIVRSPSLDVRSPAGLEGILSDDRGFERLVFLPPVRTVIDPATFERLSGEAPSEEDAGASTEDAGGGAGAAGKPERAGSATPRSLVAVTSRGPLEFHFRVPSLVPAPSGEESARTTRISLRDRVVLYEIGPARADDAIPPPGGKRFECERFQLEIASREDKPVPVYALATSPGNRVRGFFTRGEDRYLLTGDRLEWFQQGASRSPSSSDFGALPNEAVLSGAPQLTGPDISLDAERAILRPVEDRVLLEGVRGKFLRPPEAGKAERVAGDGDGRAGPGAPGNRGRPVFAERETAASPEIAADFEQLDFSADAVELHFETGEGSGKALSRLIATSREARGVVITGSDPPESEAGKTPAGGFRAAGKKITYHEEDRRLVLEGTSRELPRLSQGKRWEMEAETIELLLDAGTAWFEGRVRAYFDEQDAGSLAGAPDPKAEGDGEARTLPPFEIKSETLEVERRAGRLKVATARGTPEHPVVVNTFGGERYRFVATQARLDAEKQLVQLAGAETPSDDDRDLARIELESAEVRARRIDFDKRLWTCYLREAVDVRLFSSSDVREEKVRILAEKADVTFFDDIERPRGKSSGGPLDALDLIRSFQATAKEGERLVIRGEGFTIHGEEASWEAARKELRLFGPGMQRIDILHADLQGPVVAREILYDSERHTVTLRGDVKGRLRQVPVAASGPDGPGGPDDARKGAGLRPTTARTGLSWDFEASTVDLHLARNEGEKSLDLRELHARGATTLEHREKGLKLLGDDLIYDPHKGTVRIFSRDGRLQSLVHEPPPAPGDARGAAPPEPDKILAQEVWVFLGEGNPFERKASGEPRNWIIARFQKDVIATFQIPPEKLGSVPDTGAFDAWKMEAGGLNFHLDPRASDGTSGALPLITADGGVVVTSDAFRAEGKRGEYESAKKLLRLFGSPARLTYEKNRPRSLEKDKITIQKVRDRYRFSY